MLLSRQSSLASDTADSTSHVDQLLSGCGTSTSTNTITSTNTSTGTRKGDSEQQTVLAASKAEASAVEQSRSDGDLLKTCRTSRPKRNRKAKVIWSPPEGTSTNQRSTRRQSQDNQSLVSETPAASHSSAKSTCDTIAPKATSHAVSIDAITEESVDEDCTILREFRSHVRAFQSHLRLLASERKLDVKCRIYLTALKCMQT